MATAGSAAPAGRTGDGNNADGLKTHISTALSGLLDRALGSRAEQGGAHGTPALPAVQKSELAREMHRLIMAPTPARLVLLKASERVAGVDAPEPYPYSCLYCNCGFEHMNTRNRHMGHAHKREMYGRSAMTEKSEDDPDDCEDSDHKSKLPVTGLRLPSVPPSPVAGRRRPLPERRAVRRIPSLPP